MSQYNKTVLTHAGLELAKRANAGQAKFGITRAVTSADDWSHKTVQDLEEVTTIPNIMQQGTIMDTDEVESNNSVIGVSLCFTNKNLSTGYQIRIIGLYVKEEGQENDFLYAVTTAITPEYMPSFADKVLYKFNMQMYLVIGKAQAVNVVINEDTAVTSTQFNKYKGEVTDNLKKLENTHKEDMSHVAKSASINGGAEILPDSTGKLNLVVPDPDLSRYVSLEQLTEMLQAKADVADVNKQIKAVTDLANTKANTVDVDSKIKTVTDLANTKANSADVYTKTETDNQINKFDLSKVKFRKQYVNGDGQATDKTWSATKNDDGTYTIDLYNDDWTAAKLADVLVQLPNKADTSTVNAQITDAKNTIKSDIDNLHNDLQNQINANNQGTFTTGYDWNTGTPTNESRRLQNAWIVDQEVLRGAVDRMNSINNAIDSIRYAPQERRSLGGDDDANNIVDDGVYRISGNPIKNGNGQSWCFLRVKRWDYNTIYQELDSGTAGIFIRIISKTHNNYPSWQRIATSDDISNLQNQIQQLRDNQFEVQTFTDATAAANWEAQKPGKRMAIVNS